MPAGAGKSKFGFRRIVAPEPISTPALGVAERILARLVALAYAGDHPDLFLSEGNKPELAEPPVPATSHEATDRPSRVLG
jgi:hypothetical protein